MFRHRIIGKILHLIRNLAMRYPKYHSIWVCIIYKQIWMGFSIKFPRNRIFLRTRSVLSCLVIQPVFNLKTSQRRARGRFIFSYLINCLVHTHLFQTLNLIVKAVKIHTSLQVNQITFGTLKRSHSIEHYFLPFPVQPEVITNSINNSL